MDFLFNMIKVYCIFQQVEGQKNVIRYVKESVVFYVNQNADKFSFGNKNDLWFGFGNKNDFRRGKRNERSIVITVTVWDIFWSVFWEDRVFWLV